MDAVWNDVSTAVMPALVALFGTVMTIILNRAAAVARERWGIEVEARHREALHSAIMSGVQAALLRGAKRSDAVEAAITYARKSVPDAIGKLAPGPDVLKSIAEAKLREVLGGVIGSNTKVPAP